MSEHTPGPWYLWDVDGADFIAIATRPKTEQDQNADFISLHEQAQIEVLGSSEWLRVKPADLRLIAAAPNLLKACEEFIRFAELPGPVIRGAYVRYQVKALGAARAALAKAKGE